MYRKRHQVQNSKDRRKYEATLYRNNPKNQKKHKELKKKTGKLIDRKVKVS